MLFCNTAAKSSALCTDLQHDVVLNYLQTHAYASTARTLVQGRPGGSGSGNGLSGGGAASNGIDGLASEDAEQAGASGGGDGMDVDGSAGVAEVDKTGRSGGMKGKDKVVEGVNLDEEALVAIERRQGESWLLDNGSGRRGTPIAYAQGLKRVGS